MKEWDNDMFRCDTCDNVLFWEQWDADARMCKACAEVIPYGSSTDYASLGVCDKCDVYYVPANGHDCEEEK